MHIWALGLSCETPAAPPDRAAGARTRQPENSKRAHLSAPALQTPPKFHERTPRERKKKENCGGRREKKARNFGPPTLRGSTLRGSTLRGPHTSSQNSTTSKNWPKSNWPKSKLAEVEIDRSRNWPKSKLAEVELAELEKKSWPKSKLAEVDRALMAQLIVEGTTKRVVQNLPQHEKLSYTFSESHLMHREHMPRADRVAWRLGAKTRVLALGAAVRLCLSIERPPCWNGSYCSSGVPRALHSGRLHSGAAASRHRDPAA